MYSDLEPGFYNRLESRIHRHGIPNLSSHGRDSEVHIEFEFVVQLFTYPEPMSVESIINPRST